VQLVVKADGVKSMAVRNVGRSPLFHNGAECDEAVAFPGDTLRLGRELLLICVRRGAWIRPLEGQEAPMPFGEPDPHGILGESNLAWELRRQIAFVARRGEHVLITGESGTGKELVARAVHAASARGHAPFVSRNAATFPDSLVDAELFGHAKNYPNAGMPERQGLVGEAAGATLFLDEIAELPAPLQTHLLRVLDRGEYQRLGESTIRVSDFRFLAATNNPSKLRDDVAARLKLSVRTPGLNERPGDIPLLVVHLLRTIAKANADIGKRLFSGSIETSEPSVAIGFVEALVRHRYTTHVRELEGWLWRAIAAGPSDVLDGSEWLKPSSNAPQSARPPSEGRNHAPSPAELVSALTKNDWSLERTYRELGLTTRHALARLITKYGIKKPPG